MYIYTQKCLVVKGVCKSETKEMNTVLRTTDTPVQKDSELTWRELWYIDVARVMKEDFIAPCGATRHYCDLRVPCSRSLFPQHSSPGTSCSLFLFQEFGEHIMLGFPQIFLVPGKDAAHQLEVKRQRKPRCKI